MTPYHAYLRKCATDELPQSVDHPYMAEFMNTTGGALAGAGATAGAMAALQAAADPLARVAGKANVLNRMAGKLAPIAADAKNMGLGGLGLAALGGGAAGLIAGMGKTIIKHHQDAERYQRETGEELPVIVRHPYLVRNVMQVPGRLGAIALAGKAPNLSRSLSIGSAPGAQVASVLYHKHEKEKINQTAERARFGSF